jgi:hypothetical protein
MMNRETQFQQMIDEMYRKAAEFAAMVARVRSDGIGGA